MKGNVEMKITDLSFLKECAAPVAVKTCELGELSDFIAYATKPLGKIKISALKPEDYATRPEILEKYFKHNNVKLDRFHIPELTPERYAELVGDPKKLKNKDNANLDTASDYYIRKMRLTAVAKDLNCNIHQLDTTDYIWDERYYLTYNLIDNMRIVDDWYRDHSEDERYTGNAYRAYIYEDPRTATMDMELYTELYEFCISAIRQRKAMLLGKVDKCLSMLRNISEYTYGFTQNPTKQMMASLKSYKTYFEELLSDEAMVEFLKTNNDITVYANSELTRSDYVDTYKALIKGLVSGSDEDIIELSDLLTGIKDPCLAEIYENRPELVFQTWQLDKED